MAKVESYSGLPFRSRRETDLVAQTHYHTRRSDGFLKPIEAVEKARAAGINTFVITDHDRISGAMEAKEYAIERDYFVDSKKPATHFEIVVGEEVTTLDGHLLTLGVSELIPCKMPARETAEIAHEQGALVVVPHPGFEYAAGISWEITNGLIEEELVDGVEIWNGAEETLLFLRNFSDALPKFAQKAIGRYLPPGNANLEAVAQYMRSGKDYAVFGGQDGHLADTRSLSKVVTLYPEGMDFFDAVREKKTIASSKWEPEVWGPVTLFRQSRLSKVLEADRKNGNGIICKTENYE